MKIDKDNWAGVRKELGDRLETNRFKIIEFTGAAVDILDQKGMTPENIRKVAIAYCMLSFKDIERKEADVIAFCVDKALTEEVKKAWDDANSVGEHIVVVAHLLETIDHAARETLSEVKRAVKDLK